MPRKGRGKASSGARRKDRTPPRKRNQPAQVEADIPQEDSPSISPALAELIEEGDYSLKN